MPNQAPGSSPQPTSLLKRHAGIVNGVLFQLGWFACVIGGDLFAVLFTLFYLPFHGYFLVEKSREWLLIIGFAALGWVIDAALAALGVISFATALPIPVWLICLWLLFGTTLCHVFSWLHQRLLLSAVLGAWAGASSYWAGTQLASVTFPDVPLALAVFAVIWLFLFPLGMWLARRL